MAKKRAPTAVSDDDIRALLTRYKCPVTFHEVRTRFLGNIATPVMAVSPIKVVESLWGGTLPEFESMDGANELIGALVMGLWNGLSRHQDRSAAFRLTRVHTDVTRDALADLAMLRCQELEGFIEGLFGTEEALDFPERAHRGLEALSEMRALFAAMTDRTLVGTTDEMQATLRLLREITRNAENEIHAIVLSCARARRHLLASLPFSKPTMH